MSPGSQLMQSNGVRNIKDEIPKLNQDELKNLYLLEKNNKIALNFLTFRKEVKRRIKNMFGI